MLPCKHLCGLGTTTASGSTTGTTTTAPLAEATTATVAAEVAATATITALLEVTTSALALLLRVGVGAALLDEELLVTELEGATGDGGLVAVRALEVDEGAVLSIMLATGILRLTVNGCNVPSGGRCQST